MSNIEVGYIFAASDSASPLVLQPRCTSTRRAVGALILHRHLLARRPGTRRVSKYIELRGEHHNNWEHRGQATNVRSLIRWWPEVR